MSVEEHLVGKFVRVVSSFARLRPINEELFADEVLDRAES